EFQGRFDEMLGLGARDENRGGDFQAETVELLLAYDVLHGLVAETAGDAGVVGGTLGLTELVVGVSDEGDAWDLQGVKQQEFRVAYGGVAEMLVLSKLGGGNGESLANSHRVLGGW